MTEPKKKNFLDKFREKVMGPRHTKPAPTRRYSLDRIREDFKESALKENTQAELELRRAAEPVGENAYGPDWQSKPLERNIENRGISLREDTGVLRSEIPSAQAIDKPQLYRPAERSQSVPHIPQSPDDLVTGDVPFIVNLTDPGALRVGTPHLTAKIVPPPTPTSASEISVKIPTATTAPPNTESSSKILRQSSASSASSSAKPIQPLTAVLSQPQQQPEITLMRPTSSDLENKPPPSSSPVYVLPMQRIEITPTGKSAEFVTLPAKEIEQTGVSSLSLQSDDVRVSSGPALESSSSSLPPTRVEAHPEEVKEERKQIKAAICNLPSCVPVIDDVSRSSQEEKEKKKDKSSQKREKKKKKDDRKKPEPFIPPQPSPEAVSLHDQLLGELKPKLEPIKEKVEVRSEIVSPSIGGSGIQDSAVLPAEATSSSKDVHSELLHVMRGKRKEEDAVAEARTTSSTALLSDTASNDEHKRKMQRTSTSGVELTSVPAQSISSSTLHQQSEVTAAVPDAVKRREEINWRRVGFVYLAILLTFVYSIVIGVAMAFRILAGLSLEGVMRARNFIQSRTKKANESSNHSAQLSHIKQE